MKKKLLLAPLMAVLVACVVVLSGCGGPSVEELITEDLTTQFDEVKNGGDDFLSGLEEASGDEFEQLGIDPKEYAKTYLEGFDYKIGERDGRRGQGCRDRRGLYYMQIYEQDRRGLLHPVSGEGRCA